jgi:two-component system, repressor protein LuxO
MTQKVLLVEDSSSLAVLYKQYVKNEPYSLFHVETGAEAIDFIQRYTPHVVILDLKLPDMSGEEILDWINEHQVPTVVIIATAHGSIDIAVNLMQKGAEDFIEKPISAERLKASIHLHLKRSKLANLVEDLENRLERNHFHGFIGSSLPMQSVYHIIEAVSITNASVFIIGESGTGKEVCAQAIHEQSPRRNKPFIAINCGAIPRDLMESEIFGHVKGAFTGATTDRVGAAEAANGGTLFLDELCEMELDMQKKLLRFLQTSTFTPLGSAKEKKVDIRIICATNRDPLQEVEEGRFREDLYYRVHVVPIEMPSLRERGQDIVTLASHFLKQYAKQDGKKFTQLNAEVQSLFKRYPWPGNVRQLQNIIRNIVVLNDANTVDITHLPAQMKREGTSSKKTHQKMGQAPAKVAPLIPAASANTPEDNHENTQYISNSDHLGIADAGKHEPNSAATSPPMAIRPMADIERETIQQAIDYCDGNVINASVLLGLSPSTVYRKKQAWEMEDNTYSG